MNSYVIGTKIIIILLYIKKNINCEIDRYEGYNANWGLSSLYVFCMKYANASDQTWNYSLRS